MTSKVGVVTTVIGGLGNDRIELLGDVLNPIVSDDGLGRSGVITHGVESIGSDFNNVGVDGIGLNIVSPGSSLVNLAPTGEPLIVTENGGRSSYFINLVNPDLTALATNPVYLTVSAGLASSEDRSEGGDSILIRVNGGVFTNAAVLTFDGTTANTTFEIEIMAVNDLGEEGSRLVVISHSINSDDLLYDDLAIINLFVDVRDNDKPELDIRQISNDGTTFGDNSTVVLEGASGFDDTYSVVLNSAPAPTETVRVDLVTDSQITASSSTGLGHLLFNASNWNLPQIVTVQAVDDGPDGTEFSTIVHQISGGAVFGHIASSEFSTLEVTVYDEDTPSVIVEQNGGSTIVVDGGASGIDVSDSYRLRLTSQPLADVTLTLRSDTQTQLTTNAGGFAVVSESGTEFFEYTYTFTSANWSQWVEIDVAANKLWNGDIDPFKFFSPVAQNLDRIRGVLNVEGGIGPGEPRNLADPVMLPGETSPKVIQNSPESAESDDIDTLNIFHSDNNDADSGDLSYRENINVNGQIVVIANPGLALTGFEMGGDLRTDQGTPQAPDIVYYGGGVTINGFEIVEMLLGKGDESLSITDTGDRDARDPDVNEDPATITAIHGGGGDDTFTISGRGNGSLVVYGDTSEDRVRYSNGGPGASAHGTSFSNDGDDIIDARLMGEQNDGFVGLVAYGGFGNDEIWGSQDDDHLAGGTSRQGGHDTIDGLGGRTVRADGTPFGGTLSAGNGNNIVLGDEGFVQYQAQGLTGNTSVLREVSSLFLDNTATDDVDLDTFVQGGNETITTGTGNDIVIGSLGDDDITAGNGDNVVLGDEGGITFQTGAAGLRDLITSRYLNEAGFAPMDVGNDASLGHDTIITGTGNDVVIGGLGTETITVADGDNIVLGDEGFVQYQDQEDTKNDDGTSRSVLAEVSSLYLDNSAATDVDLDTFVQGGNETITTGTGSDFVIAGLGDDTIDASNGDNIVLGDEGSIMFQTGSGLLHGIWSEALNEAGQAPQEAGDASVGNDTITTGSGRDYVLFGSGDNLIVTGAGDDIVLGDGHIDFHATTNLPAVLRTVFLDGNDVLLPPTNNVIYGDEDQDILIGGSGHDWIEAGSGDDIVIGDEVLITFDQGRAEDGFVVADFIQTVFFTPLAPVGLGDQPVGQLIPGGIDAILGQEGDDILAGGSLDDVIDGGSERDQVFGDNVTLDRQGRLDNNSNQRFRALTGDEIYATELNQNGDLLIDRTDVDGEYGDPDWADGAPFWADFVVTGHDGLTTPGLVDLVQNDANRTFGSDILAGGSNDDMIFGQRGEDTIQGDGSVFFDVWKVNVDSSIGGFVAETLDQPTFEALNVDGFASVGLYDVPTFTLRPVAPDYLPASTEAVTDGDDYIEGGVDNDVIFGDLGQNDIIGGSSNQFGLDFAWQRAGLSATDFAAADRPVDGSGADILFGGAGLRIDHNNPGFDSDGSLVSFEDGHARNANVIVGDNGNIFRLTGTGGVDSGANLTFNYDAEDVSRGDLRVKARGVDLLDYFRWTIATAAGVAVPSHLGFDGEIGAGDLIHGGSGDDVIYGMGGDNVIFGHGGDDLIVGGYGNDWISGGVGDDGILGDDGLLAISRDSSTYGEPLYGIDPIAAGELTSELAAPGPAFHDIINVENELTHTARLFAFTFEFGGNDIAYGGLGSDSLHGGVGDDALSGAEALPGYFSGELNELVKLTQGDGNTASEAWFFNTAPFNPGDILQYQQGESAWFRLFNQLDPLRMMLVDSDGNRVDAADVEIALADSNGPQNDIANVDYDLTKWFDAGTGEEVFDFFLNFDPNEGVLDTRFTTTDPQMSDGDDVIFGDLGNDWIVGGTGRDHLWGGADDDVLNVDDNHLTTIFEQQDPIANDSADPFQAYSDIGYGGIGRDALLANTGADRIIDWIGEFNSYSVPFNPFGGHQISRQISPGLREFLYELARADGADLLVGVERGGTTERNGEPFGETTVVTSADEAWSAQHGAPLAQQPGSYPGRRVLMLRELEGPAAGTLNVDSPTNDPDITLTGGTSTSDGGTTGGDTTGGDTTGGDTTGGDTTGGDTTGGDTETPTGNNGNGGGNSNAGGNGGGKGK